LGRAAGGGAIIFPQNGEIEIVATMEEIFLSLDLIQATDSPDNIRRRGLFPHSVQYFSIRAPDTGLRAINHARPETCSKGANRVDASNSEFNVLHRLHMLRECSRAQSNQSSRYGQPQHQGTLGMRLP
jgi:hypothetical protein